MRIGIDLDDTTFLTVKSMLKYADIYEEEISGVPTCRTTEMVHEKLEEYSNKRNLNPLDIMNDEYLKDDFFKNNIEDIYENVVIKREVKQVLKRLKNKGNIIYIITSRNRDYKDKNIEDITKKWFAKEEIEVEKMIFSVYGEEKANVCRELKIDLMIEDNPYNLKKIKEAGIHCILYDDRGKYDLQTDYYTNWKDIEMHIERYH